MTNIVDFKTGLDQKTLNNLNIITDILDNQVKVECIGIRQSIFPAYHSLVLDQRYLLDGIFVGMILKLADDLKRLEINDNFRKSDFIEILEIAIEDYKTSDSFSISIPFAKNCVSVTFVKCNGIWTVIEFYTNHRSGVQRAFEIYAEDRNMSIDSIFN